jgi:hypothetical protein
MCSFFKTVALSAPQDTCLQVHPHAQLDGVALNLPKLLIQPKRKAAARRQLKQRQPILRQHRPQKYVSYESQ